LLRVKVFAVLPLFVRVWLPVAPVGSRLIFVLAVAFAALVARLIHSDSLIPVVEVSSALVIT